MTVTTNGGLTMKRVKEPTMKRAKEPRYSPLTTDLTAREKRSEVNR